MIAWSSLCVFLFLAMIAVFVPQALACSCGRTHLPCEAAWNAAAEFTGSVMDVTDPTVHTSWPSWPKRTIRIKLTQMVTGLEPGIEEVEIVTGMGNGDCGIDFKRGSSYVVYAYRNSSGRLEASRCSRTRLLPQASEDLAYFETLATAPPTGAIVIETKRWRTSTLEDLAG